MHLFSIPREKLFQPFKLYPDNENAVKAGDRRLFPVSTMKLS